VGQRRVGKAAERAGTKYASSVIYHSKRLIGCKYGDSVLQDCKALRWPFKVVDQGDGAAGIQITVAGQPKMVTPEEVGAGVLSYLKKVAEEFIGRPVKKAVITVPAYFNDSQRQATRYVRVMAMCIYFMCIAHVNRQCMCVAVYLYIYVYIHTCVYYVDIIHMYIYI